jgi:hypothetical protein
LNSSTQAQQAEHFARLPDCGAKIQLTVAQNRAVRTGGWRIA